MRHIIARFATEDKASSAATELQALGALEVTLDRIPDGNSLPGVLAAAVPPGSFGAGSFGPYGAGGTSLGPLGDAGGFVFGISGDDGKWRSGGGTGGTPVVTAAVEDRLFRKAEEIVRRNGGVIS